MSPDPVRSTNRSARERLRIVEGLLDADRAAEALQLLRDSENREPYLENARGVCLLRTAQSSAALTLYQKLTLQDDSLNLRLEQPLEFALNYALALCASNNVQGCLLVLHERGAPNDPRVVALKESVRAWRGSLSFWNRVRYQMYGMVTRPVALPTPLGWIAHPEDAEPRRAA